MTDAPLPYRPRLAEHAMARRHLVDGEEVVVVHDARSGDLVRMDARCWEIVSGCDGTRDFGGIALAATRAGAYRREGELREVLETLHRAGLLVDGIEPPPLQEGAAPERPLDVLPGFSLVCDESGVCCGFYGTVVFTYAEAARARALRPDVLGGERAFLPATGVVDRRALAVALVDGRCAYLAEGGRCSLHALGGEEAKPRGCRTYPASFVDDGEVVRVSVGVECPCVPASAAGRAEGAPLVPPGARTAADLPPGARAVVLPARIAVAGAADAPREALVVWSRAVAEAAAGAGAPRDMAAALWSLARAVAEGGLDVAAARRAMAGAIAPKAAEVLPWVEALARRAAARLEAASSWRSERDRARLSAAWMAEATAGLATLEAIEAVLGAGAEDPGTEGFYVRAVIHGHHLVDEIPIEAALRDRAVRILVGRALGPVLARRCPDDPARRFPLSLVEATLRAHGLKAYAREMTRPDAAR